MYILESNLFYWHQKKQTNKKNKKQTKKNKQTKQTNKQTNKKLTRPSIDQLLFLGVIMYGSVKLVAPLDPKFWRGI